MTSRAGQLGAPLRPWEPDEAVAIESWHYVFLGRMFGAAATATVDGTLVVTPGISDPDWNHVAALRWSDDELAERLRGATRTLELAGRRPTLAIAPWSTPPGLAARLGQLGWTPTYEHLWSTYELARPTPLEPVAGYELAVVGSRADEEAFVELFVRVYGAEGELEAGWTAGLRRSFAQPGVRNYLVRRDGETAGISSLLVDGERSQIFNMVVADGHRRRGLAEWMTQARLLDARAAGARRLVALTDNGRMDRWLAQRGFEPGWYSVGYSAPAG